MSLTHDYLFNRIADELPAITGWCELQKALDLAAIVIALRPKIVVELGVWGGRSLIPMALACEHLGSGVVIGIDPWSAPASTEGYDEVNAKWWGSQDHERVYQAFIAHVKRLGLEDRVAVERTKSADAAVPATIDLIHIDAQHCALAIADVRRFAPAVRVGGIVVIDDLEWATAGVQHVKHAVMELLALGFVELHRTKTETGCWGFFQRVAPAALSLPVAAPSGQPSPSRKATGKPGARRRVAVKRGKGRTKR